MVKSKPEDPIENALDDLDAKRLTGRQFSDHAIIIRETAEEKISIEKTAKTLNLSISEYLRRLHAVAVQKLDRRQ